MATDNLNLGKLITGDAHRDAIHIAVAPAVAAEQLRSGTYVCLNDHGEAVDAINYGVGIGIVDPFLTDVVRRGQRFWLFLLPGSITSLRHDWTHPAFERAPSEPIPVPATKPQPIPALAAARLQMHDQGICADDLSDEEVEAWLASKAWIESFASDIDQTSRRVMQAAERYLLHGDYERDDSEAYKDHWDRFEEFWGHYETFTQTKLAENADRSSFFTCSC